MADTTTPDNADDDVNWMGGNWTWEPGDQDEE